MWLLTGTGKIKKLKMMVLIITTDRNHLCLWHVTTKCQLSQCWYFLSRQLGIFFTEVPDGQKSLCIFGIQAKKYKTKSKIT